MKDDHGKNGREFEEELKRIDKNMYTLAGLAGAFAVGVAAAVIGAPLLATAGAGAIGGLAATGIYHLSRQRKKKPRSK